MSEDGKGPDTKPIEIPSGDVRALSALLVDDSSADLVRLSGMMEELGHRTRSVQDPTRVEAELAEGEFDLLMLDVVMPGRNGYAVLRAVKKLAPQLPVVLVSSKGGESDINWAFLQGAKGYVVKPYTTESLETCLNGLEL